MALFCFFDQRSLGNKQKSAVVSRFFFVSWKTNLVQTCCLSIIVKSAVSPLKIRKVSSYINLRFIDFAKFVITAVKIVKNSSIISAKITVKWKFMNVMFSVSSVRSSVCWFDKLTSHALNYNLPYLCIHTVALNVYILTNSLRKNHRT